MKKYFPALKNSAQYLKNKKKLIPIMVLLCSSMTHSTPFINRVNYTKHKQAQSISEKAKSDAKKIYNVMKHNTKEAFGIEVDSQTLSDAYFSFDLIGNPVKSKDGYHVGFIESLLVSRKGEVILIVSQSLMDLGDPRRVLFIKDGKFSPEAVFELELLKKEFEDRPTVTIKM